MCAAQPQLHAGNLTGRAPQRSHTAVLLSFTTESILPVLNSPKTKSCAHPRRYIPVLLAAFLLPHRYMLPQPMCMPGSALTKAFPTAMPHPHKTQLSLHVQGPLRALGEPRTPGQAALCSSTASPKGRASVHLSVCPLPSRRDTAHAASLCPRLLAALHQAVRASINK